MAEASAPVLVEEQELVLCTNPACLTSHARHGAFDIPKDPENPSSDSWHLRKLATNLVCKICAQPGCIDEATSICYCCGEVVEYVKTVVCRECKKPAHAIPEFYLNPGEEECAIMSFCDDSCGDFPHYMMAMECGHRCCIHCFVRAVDASIEDRSGITVVEASGKKTACLKCPIESRCISKITNTHVLALSENYRKFKDFSAEALAKSMGAIFCPLPRCGNMIMNPPTEDGVMACPWCLRAFCTHCNEAAPEGVCPKFENEEATESHIGSTCKKCPKCGWAISHFWHDACHHIGYQIGGCPGCRATRNKEYHWCYVCLRGGSSYPRYCHDNHWFCNTECDCPPCPICNAGKLTDQGLLKEGKTRSACCGHT